MKQPFLLIIQALCLLFLHPDAFAQCNNTTCTVPVPAVNAQDACILPNPQSLHCYYGATTPDLPVSFPPTWCNDINNNHWFAFIATTPSTFFTFHVYDCTGGPGIQVAVLSTVDCVNFQTVAACKGIETQISDILFVGGMIPGQVYYLCIDGTEGALCGYSINGPDPTINNAGGNFQPCVPSNPIANYNTSTTSNWTVNPPSAGMIVGSPTSNFVSVNWLQSGMVQICAQNTTCPNAPVECLDVFVSGGSSEQDVNLCAGKTVTCAGQVFNTPGLHEVHFDNGTGCDSTVSCFVHLIPIDTTTEIHTYCPGDSVACAGKYFSTPGTFPVTLTAPQGCDSLVKCMISVLPVVTPPTQVVNLCGPATYQICGTSYTASGFYSKTCTGSLGCDSLVTLNLAILQPQAVIAPPGTLGCGPNATITLSSNGSNQNTASGGLTIYTWTGPGILGPNDQPTVQINKPGSYCLILTHGRGGVFCADTACVTVGVAGTAPQIPSIAGNQQPCSHTSDIYTATAVGLPLPTDYTWTVPGNVVFTLLSPDSIVIQWPDTAVSGQVCVVALDSCGTSPAACISVVVQPFLSVQTVQICQGDTILLGGTLQNTAGVYTDTLAAVNGCDSLVMTTLIVHAVDTLTTVLTTCDPAAAGTTIVVLSQANGCDSVLITTVNLLPSDSTLVFETSCNPNATGVFLQNLTNGYGCDSTVITTITFSIADTTLLSATSCDPVATGIFTQNLIGSEGCDSVIITTVTLLPSDTTHLSTSNCNPASTGVFTQSLSNQYGCDSIVVTTVTLEPSDTTLLSASSCNPANTGVFTQTLSNQYGCDSVVITTVSLLPGNKTLLSGTSCDAANVGVFTQSLVNQFGCDSLVVTTVSFSEPDTTLLSATTCDPVAAGSFSQLLVNEQGCDSVIITTITLLPISQTTVESTTCDPAAAGVFTYSGFNQYGCDSTTTETVLLLPSSTTTLTLTTCNPLQVDTTTEILANQYGCDSTVTTITTLLPLSGCGISATLLGSNIACTANTGSLTVTATLGAAPFDYTILSGSTSIASGTIATVGQSQVLTGLAAGNYTLQISSANGLSTTAAATIVQLLPPALNILTSHYSGYEISCNGAADGNAQALVSGGTAPYNFAWSNGSTTPEMEDLIAGNYTVTVTDANACTAIATTNLTEPAPLSFTLSVNNLDCFDTYDGAIQVDAQGGAAPYHYTLGNGNPQTSNIFSNLTAGTYSVTTADANDCQRTEIILVNAAVHLSVDLGDNQTIALGDTTILQAIVNVPADSILLVAWTPPTDTFECAQCLSQTVAPFVSTTYSVVVTTLNGCSGTDQITVIVDRRRYLFTPNVFSPNGDGQNDQFRIFAKSSLVRSFKSFRIFDRWGEIVYVLDNFPPDDPHLGWDGRLNGQLMNPAVFIWVAEVEFVDGTTETFQGDVTLVR